MLFEILKEYYKEYDKVLENAFNELFPKIEEMQKDHDLEFIVPSLFKTAIHLIDKQSKSKEHYLSGLEMLKNVLDIECKDYEKEYEQFSKEEKQKCCKCSS